MSTVAFSIDLRCMNILLRRQPCKSNHRIASCFGTRTTLTATSRISFQPCCVQSSSLSIASFFRVRYFSSTTIMSDSNNDSNNKKKGNFKFNNSNSSNKRRKDSNDKKSHTWREEKAKNAVHPGSYANPAMRELFGVTIPDHLLPPETSPERTSRNNDASATAAAAADGGADNNSGTETEPKRKFSKKKVAFLLAYLGTGYSGFQVGPIVSLSF